MLGAGRVGCFLPLLALTLEFMETMVIINSLCHCKSAVRDFEHEELHLGASADRQTRNIKPHRRYMRVC